MRLMRGEGCLWAEAVVFEEGLPVVFEEGLPVVFVVDFLVDEVLVDWADGVLVDGVFVDGVFVVAESPAPCRAETLPLLRDKATMRTADTR